ncbi:MAG: tetratricopeptide repeat protein, partial [Candidatus Solibacter sp.]|nr:tetratricopeptide repeat protein [Candidatus Solibacter sp.]
SVPPERSISRGCGGAARGSGAVKRSVLAVALLGAVAWGAQNPSPGQAAYEKANALFSAQRFQESMNALDEALRLDPKLVPALTLRAKLAMGARRYDVAQESLERALAANPASAYAQFLYGFQFYERNQMPAAIAALEKARTLNPRDARAALYLGPPGTNRAEAADRDAARLLPPAPLAGRVRRGGVAH